MALYYKCFNNDCRFERVIFVLRNLLKSSGIKEIGE